MSNLAIGFGSTLPKESNGAVPVNIQDQTSDMLNLYFVRQLGASATATAPADMDTYELVVDDTTGFIKDQYVGIFCGTGEFYFGHLTEIPAANTLKFDTPFDHDLEEGCTVLNMTKNLAVNGSVTRLIYQIGPVGAEGAELDITRITGIMVSTSAMNDTKFGGSPALPMGVVFRKNNGRMINYGTWKTNGDIAVYCAADMEVTEKVTGIHSGRFRGTNAGQNKRGVTIRLAPGDTLEIIIQDNLTANSSFEVMAQGHIVTD